MKHIFHRESCELRARDSFVDIYGRVIILSGQHAFEWTVTIEVESLGISTQTIYKNRKQAREVFNRYKKDKKK